MASAAMRMRVHACVHAAAVCMRRDVCATTFSIELQSQANVYLFGMSVAFGVECGPGRRV